jgi:hypothetical protein
VALEWQPEHLDYFPQRRRPIGGSSAINLDPIVNPPPPVELVWQSWFPAQCFSRQLQRANYLAFVTGSPFLGTALRTPPVYPNQILRQHLRQYSESFEISGMIALPAIASWRPRFPDRLDRRLVRRAGWFSYVTPPSVILDSQPCLTWVDEDLVLSSMAEEAVGNSTMASETLTSSDLDEEGVC